MHVIAPTPPGDGAVMWWASALLAPPSTSPRIVAPRASAASHSSSTNDRRALAHHEPVAVDVERTARAGASRGRSCCRSRRAPWPCRRARCPRRPRRRPGPTRSAGLAYVRACVPAAQAVQIVSFGPRNPNRIDTAAPGALAIIIGTRNGDTRRSPFSRRIWICSSSVWMPPTPVPKIVPIRAGSTVELAGLLDRFDRGRDRELLDEVGAAGVLGRVVVRRRIPVGRSRWRPAPDRPGAEQCPSRTRPCRARRVRRPRAR